jgi:hypothetical protein
MNLDDLSVHLRRRSRHEALDLGVRLLREYAGPIALGWIVAISPLFVLVGAATILHAWFWPWLVALVWLKPLYARVPLFVISRSVFGEIPSSRRTLQHVVSRALSWQGLYDVTIGRLNPFRGFVLPIYELEHQSGSDASRRRSTLLDGDHRATCLVLMAICAVVEILGVVAGLTLVDMILPTTLDPWFGRQLQHLVQIGVEAPVLEGLIVGSYFLSVAWTESLYIATSFGLYLNRRVELEGWNVELTFRRLARRLDSLLVAAGLAISIVLGIVPGGAPETSEARSPETSSTSQTSGSPSPPAPGGVASAESPDPQQTIDEILDDPTYPHVETRTTWEIRDDWMPDWEWPEDWNWNDELPKGGGVALWAARLLEVLLWGLAIVAAVVSGRYLWRGETPTLWEEDAPPVSPGDAGVANVEEVPDLSRGLVERATSAWERGEQVEALALLYRGTLRELGEAYDIEITPDTTARECAERVRRAGGPADYVSELARAWTAAVYAGRPPSDDEARELFESWRRWFDTDGACD